MKSIRKSVILLIIPVVVVFFYFSFTTCRFFVAGYPQRTIIFPNGFVGRAYVVENSERGNELTIHGFWNREVMVQIPPSGILAVRTLTPFTWMTREKISLEDGTILGGTGLWFRRPSRVREIGYESRGSVPPSSPLHPYCNRNGSIAYINYEVTREPQFESP